MNLRALLSLPILLLLLASCDKYHSKTTIDEPAMAENERVYGNVDGPAKQTLQEYPANPNLIELQMKTKMALYAEQWGMDMPKQEEPDMAVEETADAEPLEEATEDSTAMDSTAFEKEPVEETEEM